MVGSFHNQGRHSLYRRKTRRVQKPQNCCTSKFLGNLPSTYWPQPQQFAVLRNTRTTSFVGPGHKNPFNINASCEQIKNAYASVSRTKAHWLMQYPGMLRSHYLLLHTVHKTQCNRWMKDMLCGGVLEKWGNNEPKRTVEKQQSFCHLLLWCCYTETLTPP